MSRSNANAFPAHYNLLEVSPRARQSVIQAAYRALSKELHPDREGGDASLFSRISEAYEVVSDPDKRSTYDKKATVTEGTVIGNYRIIEEIAEGGFGTTFRGEHLIANEPVCIKHCHHVSAVYNETLIQEAKAVWDLRHYSLPVMRDFLKLDDGSLALVMSYIPGPTLEQVVDKVGRLAPKHVAWITERVLNALMYLHFHGVVHGDIKPQNIIVQHESHRIVLVDFGLSMVKPTRNDDSKGYTPVFSPPEQLNGAPLVPESDFYSLGMTMLYALGGSPQSAVKLEVPTDVPDPLCAFVKRLVKREVRQRPNWSDENLFDSFQEVRMESFGQSRTDMEPIPGL